MEEIADSDRQILLNKVSEYLNGGEE